MIIISPYLTISPASKTPAMTDANKLSYHDFPIPKPRILTTKSMRNEYEDCDCKRSVFVPNAEPRTRDEKKTH